MKMLFRQRIFSWFDSYDIYDEYGNTIFTVKGKLSWGHKLVVYDNVGRELGLLQQKVLVLLPTFEIYRGNELLGTIRKEFTLLRPRYDFDYNGWHVDGGIMEWDYEITDQDQRTVAVITKELFHMTDTYVIDVAEAEDAIPALMFVLAIDAEKCSRSKG